MADISEVSRVEVAGPDAALVGADRGGLRRLWNAPLSSHLAALGLVLVALLALVGPSSSFSADEGAAIIQARSLADGEGWVVEHPLPELDPTGANYPLELSERGPDGTAPFGKHTLYALLLAGADRLGGVTAMVLLSLLGTVAAAGLAAALARRIDATLARPALWVVGLASPLLFDGFLVIAHTLGAALAAAAVLVATVALERRSPAVALGVLPLVTGTVLLRREAVFLALALGVAGAVLFVRRGSVRWPAGVLALGAPAAAAMAHLAERAWTTRLVGGSLEALAVATPASGSQGMVAGRVRSFLLTWLTPTYGPASMASLALLAMVAALAAGALTLRRHPEAGSRVVTCGLVAAGCALLALAAAPATVVPGLLIAFPLATAGLLLVERGTLRTTAAHLAFGVFTLFALAVIATQYTKGGSGEWGGRYFAVGLPFLTPVLLLALRQAGGRLAPQPRRRAVAALAVCSVALATMGVATLRSSHRNTAQLVAMFDRAGGAAGTAQPVLLTTEGSAPRFAWQAFDRQRWLLAEPSGLGDVLDRLRTAGVARLAFVTRNLERDRPQLGPRVTVLATDGTASDRGWHVLVLQLTVTGPGGRSQQAFSGLPSERVGQ